MHLARVLLASIAVCFPFAQADATIRFCAKSGEPAQDQVMAVATISLPTDNIGVLKRRFEKLSEELGMTRLERSEGIALGALETQTIGLFNDDSRVAILVKWQRHQKFANVEVKQQFCPGGPEPWRGYWSGFLHGLRRAGYRVR